LSRAAIRKYYFDVISKRAKGPVSSLLRALLGLLSLAFRAGVAIRKKFLRPSYRPRAFTISVGNIVAGGTGKTPFTIFLAEWLASAQHSTAVLLRGYKALAEKQDEPSLFRGGGAQAEVVGDEACLIGRRVPDALVIAGKNKVKGAALADSREIQVLIVDDGMQHLKLARDLEIVMIDNQNPFGYGHLLPRGLLREPLSALKRADLVVLTCRNGQTPQDAVRSIIQSHTSAPIVTGRYVYEGLFDLNDCPCKTVTGMKVGVFTAIAKPEQFALSIVALGLDVVTKQFAPDHEAFDPRRLQAFANEALSRGAQLLVCTEKDRVKLADNLYFQLPVYWLKIGFEIEPSVAWDQICQKILCQKIRKKVEVNDDIRTSCTTSKKQ
jgi:tetraacyldisaccharide 4'-kinase